MAPNADMCAVSGANQFLIIKRWDRTDKGVMLHSASLGPQPERQCVDPAAAFETSRLVIRRRPTRRLESIEAILDVLRGDREVVSRTTFAIDGGEVTVEYPVKTVNFSPDTAIKRASFRPERCFASMLGDENQYLRRGRNDAT